MEKYKTFDEFWPAYSELSSLNKQRLSFLDVDAFRDEMKLAFGRELPLVDVTRPDDSGVYCKCHRPEPEALGSTGICLSCGRRIRA